MRQLSEQEIVRIHEDYVRQCLAEIAAAGQLAELVNTGPLVPACKAIRSRLGERCAPSEGINLPVRGCDWPALCACSYRALRE